MIIIEEFRRQMNLVYKGWNSGHELEKNYQDALDEIEKLKAHRRDLIVGLCAVFGMIIFTAIVKMLGC